MRRGRYCRVTTCPNFKGAKKTTPLFNSPSVVDPSLRDKWIRWLRTVEPKFDERLVGLNFNLCDLHFDTDDMRRTGERYRLVPGTIPKYFIPHPDPLANAESTSGDELNSEKVTTLASTESPLQSSSDQTNEVPSDKNMTSNVSEKSKKKSSYCKKCIDVNVDVQSLKVKLSKSENRLTNQKSIIDSLRNMLNDLKKAQKSEIPKTDVCLICCGKVPAGSLYEHLCVETNDEDLSIFKTNAIQKMIKCAYCTRSFTATIKLTEHLKFSHMIKAYTASCNECEQHYAMKELLQVHMMAKHAKKKISKRTPPQNTQRKKSPIPMLPLNGGTELIELELEKPEEPESVEMNVDQPSEHLESPETMTTNYLAPKRMRLEAESCTISEHSYSSDGNDMAEMVVPSNDHNNESQTNEVNNKPQLRRLKIIKKKNAIEPQTSVPSHFPAIQETIKITVEPMPMAVDKDDPLLKPYECGYECGERFAQPQELNQHMRRNHGISGNRVSVECYQCFERFPKMKDLKDHLLTFHESEPTKDKSRLCDQCGVVCKTKQQMEMHCKSHQNKTRKRSKKTKTLNGNPYCDICKISFRSKPTYWRHTLKHKEDQGKKYACDQCPMRFVDMSQFKSHSRMHTGEKPFQCEYCDPKRLFRYKKGLKTHLQMHFGVYIYGCEIQNCEQRFQYHKELQEHMKSHHD